MLSVVSDCNFVWNHEGFFQANQNIMNRLLAFLIAISAMGTGLSCAKKDPATDKDDGRETEYFGGRKVLIK